MLSDRSYMRSDYPQRHTSAVVWLLAGVIAAFLIELALLAPWFGPSGEALISQLRLTVRSVQNGHLWTLVTHSLLHNPNPLPIAFTVLGLIFVGREVEPLLGRNRFFAVYFGSILLGALAWTGVHWIHGGIHMGAAAGVMGLFVVLVCFYPEQKIDFPILFLIPFTIRPKYLAYTLVLVNGLALAIFEIPGSPLPLDYAPSAHLAGMLAGWLYFRFFHANNGWDRVPTVELPGWMRRNTRTDTAVATVANHQSEKSSADLRAEVDLILDKINSQGFGALTEDEKRILDEAKDLLSRS